MRHPPEILEILRRQRRRDVPRLPQPVDRVMRKRPVRKHRAAVPRPRRRHQRIVGVQLARLQPPGQHLLLGDVLAQNHRETVGPPLYPCRKRESHLILTRLAAASHRPGANLADGSQGPIPDRECRKSQRLRWPGPLAAAVATVAACRSRMHLRFDSFRPPSVGRGSVSRFLTPRVSVPHHFLGVWSQRYAATRRGRVSHVRRGRGQWTARGT